MSPLCMRTSNSSTQHWRSKMHVILKTAKLSNKPGLYYPANKPLKAKRSDVNSLFVFHPDQKNLCLRIDHPDRDIKDYISYEEALKY